MLLVRALIPRASADLASTQVWIWATSWTLPRQTLPVDERTGGRGRSLIWNLTRIKKVLLLRTRIEKASMRLRLRLRQCRRRRRRQGCSLPSRPLAALSSISCTDSQRQCSGRRDHCRIRGNAWLLVRENVVQAKNYTQTRSTAQGKKCLEDCGRIYAGCIFIYLCQSDLGFTILHAPLLTFSLLFLPTTRLCPAPTHTFMPPPLLSIPASLDMNSHLPHQRCEKT